MLLLTQLTIVEVDSLIELVVRNVTDMQHKPGRRKDLFPGVCDGANFCGGAGWRFINQLKIENADIIAAL